MVDGGGLENRWTGNGPGGSNPSPSANLVPLTRSQIEDGEGICRPHIIFFATGLGDRSGTLRRRVTHGWSKSG